MRKAADPLSHADGARREVTLLLDDARRAELGQFLTPDPIAAFMASMFRSAQDEVRLLDAGAGVGSLTAAFVAEMCRRETRPRSIEATGYEIDSLMLHHLRRTFECCEEHANSGRMKFVGHVVETDFIGAGATLLDTGLYGQGAAPRFNAAILNPPYKKIRSQSKERKLLRTVGIETSNLYTAFVGLAIKLLEPHGELVAITPRSFCNGPYFQPFRRLLLSEMSLLQVHVFESRGRAFKDDSVLQENVIIHARKDRRRTSVVLSTSNAPDSPVLKRRVEHDMVVSPRDPNAFIHLALSVDDSSAATRMQALPCSLDDLGVQVSTGRVVDFRARQHLKQDPGPRTVPLIYPAHFENGYVTWPILGGRKPNALAENADTRSLMVDSGTYVLTKRFTSKEERRRVVAAVYDSGRLPRSIRQVGFENHINYFHINGSGLSADLARGLAAYLNSSLVDRCFRQFNGHTQVNAVDLRSLRYPHRKTLIAIGRRIGAAFPDQVAIDCLLDEELGA